MTREGVAMTRDELKKQVVARVKVPVGSEGGAQNALDVWLGQFRHEFKFGPHEFQAACRLVRRELRLK
jgi:hypothetical protein